MSEAEGTAADLAVRRPKTLPADATVGDVRDQLADDHVHLSLLVEGDRLVGTVLRDDLAAVTDDAAPALAYATLEDRVVAPDLPAADLREVLAGRRARRAAVVDDAGDLVGLVCLNRRRSGYCTDEGVAARAAEHLAIARST